MFRYNVFVYVGYAPNKRKFNLERVGQYLEDKNLQIPPRNNVTSEWNKLLAQNECLKNSDVIYPHHKELSLVQEHKLLQKSIKELFSKPEKLIGDSFKFKISIDFAELDEVEVLQMHHINIESRKQSLFSATVSNKHMYFIEFTSQSDFMKIAKFQFLQKPYLDSKFNEVEELKFRHSQFYNEHTISMLLDTMEGQRLNKSFIQFPIQNIQSRLLGVKLNEHVDITESVVTINLYEILDPTLLRTLEAPDGHLISVSGSRKVASVLSESLNRVRHYEMEVEEDDDELEQTNTSLDASKETTKSN